MSWLAVLIVAILSVFHPTVVAHPKPKPPAITSFTAVPASITQGQPTTLSWTTARAVSCTLQGAAVPCNGSAVEKPQQTTVYTLAATAPAGTVTAKFTVTVSTTVVVTPPNPTATLTCTPAEFTTGASSTCQWSTANATTASLTGPAGTVLSTALSGSLTVSPTNACGTDTYTLTATGPTSTTPATQTAILTVDPVMPTATLTASAASITSGQSVTLTWSVTNAATATLGGSDGVALPALALTSGSGSGTVTVTPAQTTTYSLTATPICAPGASVPWPSWETAVLTGRSNSTSVGALVFVDGVYAVNEFQYNLSGFVGPMTFTKTGRVFTDPEPNAAMALCGTQADTDAQASLVAAQTGTDSSGAPVYDWTKVLGYSCFGSDGTP